MLAPTEKLCMGVAPNERLWVRAALRPEEDWYWKLDDVLRGEEGTIRDGKDSGISFCVRLNTENS